jgi:hypothetical protein
MILSLPHDIQKNLIERCPQLNFVCKSLRLQNFTKPVDLCYPNKENDKDDIIIIEHIEILKEHKEVLKLEFREGIKGILKKIEEYMERDNVRSLNTNSVELYNALWPCIEKLQNHPNKKNIIQNWKYSSAYDYAFTQSSYETYETRLRFFFNFVMYLYH